MSDGINEATFEARVVAELLQLFPALRSVQLNIQNILSLHLGHSTASVDAQASERMYGRYDVLVSIGDKPALLFEHKRPGLKLTNDDRDQVVSYARLLDPMPPLCVVSNGADVRAFKTVDKSPWSPKSIDEQAVDGLIREGFQLAASDLDDAVSRLLGQDPSVWRPVVATFTEENINELTGPLSDVARPLAKGFSIPRQVVGTVLEHLKNGRKLVALTGPPLSGKTNVLAQLADECIKIGMAPLYLDAADAAMGVPQTVANMFSMKLFRSRSPDDVRQWLMIGLRGAATAKLVFLVDGWNTVDGHGAKESLHELMRICDSAQVAVVLAIDDATWRKIAYQRGRAELTRIGRIGAVVEVAPLNDDECDHVQNLAVAVGAAFHDGWRFNPDFRHARLLRLELAEATRGVSPPPITPPPTAPRPLSMPIAPPITTLDLLARIEGQYLQQPELRADYREFAKLCVDEILSSLSPELTLFCYRRGAVRRGIVRARLGDRLGELISIGHLRDADSPTEPFVIPTLPELVSAAAIPFLRDEATQRVRSGNVDAAVEYLLACGARLPIGEVAVALCLTTLQENVLTPVMAHLMEMRPARATLPAGTRILTQIDGRQVEHTLTEEEAADGSGTENIWAALILSHLAGYLAIVKTDDNEELNTDVNFQLWWDIGSFADVLLSVPGNGVRSYHVHGFENGTCLCSEQGIIEPITWSMQCAFHIGLNDMSMIAAEAVKADRIFLAMRLHHAAHVARTAVDKDTAERASEVCKLLKPYLRDRLKASADQFIQQIGEPESPDA